MSLYRIHYYNFGTTVFIRDRSQTPVVVGWRGLEGWWVPAIDNNYFSLWTLAGEETLFNFGDET